MVLFIHAAVLLDAVRFQLFDANLIRAVIWVGDCANESISKPMLASTVAGCHRAIAF